MNPPSTTGRPIPTTRRSNTALRSHSAAYAKPKPSGSASAVPGAGGSTLLSNPRRGTAAQVPSNTGEGGLYVPRTQGANITIDEEAEHADNDASDIIRRDANGKYESDMPDMYVVMIEDEVVDNSVPTPHGQRSAYMPRSSRGDADLVKAKEENLSVLREHMNSLGENAWMFEGGGGEGV